MGKFNKLIILALITSTGLFLVGCTPKSTSTTGNVAVSEVSPPADISQSATSGTSSVAPTGGTGNVATGPTMKISDASQISVNFQKNYQVALQDANTSLQNKAKYCGVITEYVGPFVTTYPKESFFFYADELSKDYYWVVSFDALKNNQKQRLFAARRDYKDQIKCMTTPPAQPSDFVASYQALLDSGKTNSLTATQVGRTTIATWDTKWLVTMAGFEGQNMLSEQTESTSASTTASTSATTVTQ
ncbi:MAG: hypothetical protein NTZ65_03580 [Candidatus Berkelbacteria bacterium]|nr:hypothetical protein [Candidatus Berkelbacteria bacterium]